MEALRSMARVFMLKRAMAAAWPALKTTPATSSSNLGRAGGLVEEAVLDEASIQEFCRLAADNYVKQMKVARATGVGFAGVAAAALAGFGIDRLNSSIPKDQ